MPTTKSESPTSDAALFLQTLGGTALFSASDPDQQRPLLELGKPLALITYVACAPKQEVAREHLYDLLWADLDPEGARHAFRQTLWYLRRRIQAPILAATREIVTIATTLRVDRDELLTAVQAGDAERVIDLYKGDFIPTYAAPGGARFEHWAEVERAALRGHFFRSAETVIRQQLGVGRFRDAQNIARRLRDTDKLRESAWRLLIESLLAGSDSVAALIEAENLERLLAAEDQEPEPATRSLVRLAKNPAATTRTETQGELVAALVGREKEFAIVLDGWNATQAGQGRHIHITAPAGLGKTRLLNDLRARIRASRGRVVMIRASIGQRDLAYSTVSDLAAGIAPLSGARGISSGSASALIAMNPTLSSHFHAAADHAQGSEALRRRTLAISELIAATSHDYALAIIIDDIHWSDESSRAAWKGVLSSTEGSRVLFVTASRPAVETEITTAATVAIALNPLRTNEVDALIESIAALPDDEWASALPGHITRATSGVPLLVLETLQLAMERGLLARKDHAWQAPDPAALIAAIESGSAVASRVTGLDPASRQVLLSLAAAGTPVDLPDLAAITEPTVPDVKNVVNELERRGFVRRTGERVTIVHDEIAAATLDSWAEHAVVEAHQRIGRTLWQRNPADIAAIRHAARHLREAHDIADLRQLFLRYVRIQRTAGDRRPDAELATDLLGAGNEKFIPKTLVAALPWSWRLGLYSRARIGMVAALVVILAAVAAPWVGNPAIPPDAELYIFAAETDSTATQYRLPLRESDWSVGDFIDLNNVRSRQRVPVFTQKGIAVRPVSGAWTFDRPFAGTRGFDLVEVDRSGKMTRLTHTDADDQQPSWSPDGRLLAFVTGGWNNLARYDLAVLDRQTQASRQLTSSDDIDLAPQWSPDGSRIAFTRRDFNDGSESLCIINVDGGRLRCHGGTIGQTIHVSRWHDANRLIIYTNGSGQLALESFDLISGTTTLLEPVSSAIGSVSPDGVWAVCTCVRSGFQEGTLFIVPLGKPHLAKPVVLPGAAARRIVFAWELSRSRYVDSLHVSVGPGSPVPGVPHRLHVHGMTAVGDSILPQELKWSIEEGAIARLDSLSGELLASDTGSVVVSVTAGGWRTSRHTVRVLPRDNRELARFDWSVPLDRDWLRFGSPRPLIEAADSAPTLRPNGDADRTSGVLSRNEFDSSRGLALDVELSTPITMMQWQQVDVGFQANVDVEKIAPVSIELGDLAIGASLNAACTFAYPGASESAHRGDSLAMQYAHSKKTATAPRWMRNGQPYKVRIQLLPDGRCAIAVNGIPVLIAEKGRADRKHRIQISGASVETRIAVGQLHLRAGVPKDIDWTSFRVRRD